MADNLILQTSDDRFQFDAASGRLVSFRRKSVPDVELITTQDDLPAFVIQYLDAEKRFRELDSRQAESIHIEPVRLSDSRAQVKATFARLGGFDIGVTATIEADSDARLSEWSLELRNAAGLNIISVQYPFVVVPYTDPVDGDSALVWPVGAGVCWQNPQPYDLQPDSPEAWQMRPENTGVLHYPGFITAQFMAHYRPSAGVYIAAQDGSGSIKLIKPVHRRPGLRLGIAHVGDWPQNGARTLEYKVVVGSFSGDWYAAATLYRDWAATQSWTQTPLHQDEAVPDWLLDSPAHLMVRMQGELDLGPAEPNAQFLPYPKLLPLLQAVSDRIQASVAPIIMAWERGGPWVYPDCFPPVGGDSLLAFTAGARERGWHVGTYSNGTRWVLGHYWSGYDGHDYFDSHHAEQSICRTHTGSLWAETWDATWRPSFTACLGAEQTASIAHDFVQQVIDYGIDWIQFLDQNVGVCTFPCYSDEHGHPPAPGRWMTEAMLDLTAFFRQKQAEVLTATQGQRKLAFSVEGPVCEFYLPYFQICDIRVVPPGNEAQHPWWKGFIPLYHFLYHEQVLIQGGFGHGADPHHLAIRNAYNLVVGEIPGAVLAGDGQLLNKDNPGINWAPWEPPLGDNDESLAMLQSAVALRRGAGKPYLVYGRMLPPTPITTMTISWEHDREVHHVPAVFNAVWQSPAGDTAMALANWTQQAQTVTITDARLTTGRMLHTVAQAVWTHQPQPDGDSLTVTLPPLSCAVLEAAS